MSRDLKSSLVLTGEVLLLLLLIDGLERRFGAGLISPTTGTPLYPDSFLHKHVLMRFLLRNSGFLPAKEGAVQRIEGLFLGKTVVI